MKKTSLLLAVLMLLGGIASAQNKLKLGHIDSQVLLSAMPQSDSAQKKLEKFLLF